MPVVSVIIPTYNNARYLGEAIDSVLIQTFKDYEIIVVNDGSTDETPQVIDRYRSAITYIEKKNGGPSSARNAGLSQARGKFISFLDADDLYLPEKLERQVCFLESHPEIGVVYSDGFRRKENLLGAAVSIKLSQTGEVLNAFASSREIFHTLVMQNVFPIHNALARKECIISVGGFDEALTASEDWDLWFRIAEKYSFAYLDGDVSVYRVTPDSNSTDSTRLYRELEAVMRKIFASPAFITAPPQVQQQFFYRRGIIALARGDPEFARACFQQSLSFPWNRLLAFSGLVLSILFGKKAFEFYKMKRKVFGMRGVKQL